jgi:hypothetical protein
MTITRYFTDKIAAAPGADFTAWLSVQSPRAGSGREHGRLVAAGQGLSSGRLGASIVEVAALRRLHRLAGLQQNTSGDLQTAVRLQLQRIQRLPRHALGIEDVNALRDLAVGDASLAEFKTLVAIDRGIAAPDHGYEGFGIREYALDRGRGVRVRRREIVAAEGLLLRADYVLRGGDVVCGAGRSAKADQQCGEQDQNAHDGAPVQACFTKQLVQIRSLAEGVLPAAATWCAGRVGGLEIVQKHLALLWLGWRHVVAADHQVDGVVPSGAAQPLRRHQLEIVTGGAGIEGLVAP